MKSADRKRSINDPQLTANEIVVPLEGAGGKLTSTISSPIQVHGVTKVSARRAPALASTTKQILEQLGFDAAEIESLRGTALCRKQKNGRQRPLDKLLPN